VQSFDRLARFASYGVCHGDYPRGLPVHRDEYRCLALQRELLAPRGETVFAGPRYVQEPPAPDEDVVTLHPRPHAPAARGAEPLGLGEGETPPFRAPNDSLAQRVLAGPFG
jgi:hypothetical protein